MTQPNADDGKSGASEKTFTQAELDRVVRDRLAREREKYADYDDLKSKAAEADKGKGQLDRIEAKLAESEKRAAKAERANMLREVADELKISMKQLSRLKFEGDSVQAMVADAREAMDDMGMKPGTAVPGDVTDEGDGKGNGSKADDVAASTGREDSGGDRQRRTPGQRPQEDLRSGSGSTPSKEETDPRKLADMIMGRS
jgi:hypothetical protein